MANLKSVIRRCDSLGRIVIPRDIRHKLNITEGVPLEISIEGETVVIQKAEQIFDSAAEVLHNAFKHIVCDENLNDDDKNSILAKLNEAQNLLRERKQ